MLQKLYQHLEQINANTRQQQTDIAHAEEWAGKISQQLDELNVSIRSLAESNTASRSMEQPKVLRRSGQPLLIGGMAGIGLILLAILWTNIHGMSAAADSDRENWAASLAAYTVVNTHTEAVAEKAAGLDARTTRLDSIVTQQAQTIEELKKLNVSAVRTVFYLQRELSRQRRQEPAQAVVR